MKELRMKGRLKQKITHIFQSSLGYSTCNFASRTIADSVQEPIFVSSRRHDFHRLAPSHSLPSSSSASSSTYPQQQQHLLLHHHRTHPQSASFPQRPQVPVRFSSSRPTAPRKKERRVAENGTFYETTVAGDREGHTCPPVSPASPLKEKAGAMYGDRKKEKEGKKGKGKGKGKGMLLSNSYGFTSSSDDDLLFSSDEEVGGRRRRRGGRSARLMDREEETTETLISSKSFSSDSSEFYHNQRKKKNTMASRHRHHLASRPKTNGSSRRFDVHDDGFRPVVSVSSNGKRNMEEERIDEEVPEYDYEGPFPVEKESSDAYADFRISMVEMIMERQIFGSKELEHLLRSYLSLNSSVHHATIIRVFSDICDVLFNK